jgi:hypothetical protein
MQVPQAPQVPQSPQAPKEAQSNPTERRVVIVKSEPSPMRSFYSVFHTVIALFAIYLSFKCNNGFAIGDFLIACCCPVLYIIYRAATSNFCAVQPGKVVSMGPQ